MGTDRINAFTDGVLAIVITIMVLELPVPQHASERAILALSPLLIAYALSFINIGIFWANHHHLMKLVARVDGRVLWANLFLLFWLSLVPFIIRWIGEAGIEPGPVAGYGVLMSMASAAYVLLERAIMRVDKAEGMLAVALGDRRKEWLSSLLYLAGIVLAFFFIWASVICYVIVAALWIVPDRRVERQLREAEDDADRKIKT